LQRYSLYSPDLSLLAETTTSTDPAPPIAYEYIWFAGQPAAQVETATGTTHFYFNDHLGTPILQTNATGAIDWRVECEPFGSISSTRLGASRHQPFGFPGQEYDELDSDRSYNIFRWYRADWGRYSQADPIAREIGWLSKSPQETLFSYANANPLGFTDPRGLTPSGCCDCPERLWSYSGVTSGIGAAVGITYSQGTYTCISKPSLEVRVKTTCIQYGLFAGINFGSKENSIPARYPRAAVIFPAGKACWASELTDPEMRDSLFGNAKAVVVVNGSNKATGTLTIGLTVGTGVGYQQCYSNPWR
jgi:RHS repeat-associated protein